MRQEPDDRGSDVGATDDVDAPLRRHAWAQTDRRAQQANGARLYASVDDTVLASARVAGGRKWPRARRRQGGRGGGCWLCVTRDCKAERESTDSTRLLPGCQAARLPRLLAASSVSFALLVTGVDMPCLWLHLSYGHRLLGSLPAGNRR
jgi:hypothetical protein